MRETVSLGHSTGGVHCGIALGPGLPSLRQARDRTRSQLAAWGIVEQADTAVLLVNELVTNVLCHAPGPVRLNLFLENGILHCEVLDGHRTRPRPGRADVQDESGRGLRLVEALAGRWGSHPVDEGKAVWFELSVSVQ
jgi:two-component sensor histidine kinase